MNRIYFDRHWSGELRIYIYGYEQSRSHRKRYVLKIEPAEDIPLGANAEPSAVFREEQGELLLKSIIEGLREAKLIPEPALDAELRAVKYHLEDFRKLVFEERKI